MTNFSIAQALVEASQMLRRAGIMEARRDASALLAHLLGRDATYLIAHAERELTASDVARYRSFIERRAAGEPLQYITGRQEFFNLDFTVTPDVLIPRPETELLVETALELMKETNAPPFICDVGTGTGCIAISILHERRQARGVALDISPTALKVAAQNAARHDVRERLAFAASDCLDALDAARTEFSLIVSNPPYVAERAYDGLQREVREHEPRVALTPGGDGLGMIRRLLADAPRFLSTRGHLLLEIGFDQHEAVNQMIDNSVWTLLDIHKDLQGIPRTVALRKQG
ncbi:MAG: peptide chain release factor N(5)-glutamine methyltransferase [Pyrinomonadaceae bacterium]|nr:peptide chain release factor N(5)-glutamine methyltransferase [Pyrinomonadaceae bacterium]